MTDFITHWKIDFKNHKFILLHTYLNSWRFVFNMCVYIPGDHRCPKSREGEKGIASMGVENKGSCELCDVGAGNQTHVPWKNRKFS